MKADPKVEGVGTDFTKVIKIGDGEYEQVHPQAAASSRILVDMWQKLGRPKDPFTPSGQKMMNIIIATWEDGYPKEARLWYENRKDYQKSELDVKEQVHRHTGRSLASYPLKIYAMMKTIFPDFKPAERKNCIKMVRKWPMFRMANKV